MQQIEADRAVSRNGYRTQSQFTRDDDRARQAQMPLVQFNDEGQK